jgi:50S ribosomal protein L16 3-hydroxylase
MHPFTHLGEMPVSEFIRDYWQQKPLLIRQAVPGFVSPVSPEELAGLTLEPEIESRLVIETPGAHGISQWDLEHGPLEESRFAHLPASHWTLLVQAVDQLFPEVHQLLNRFRFIPNWRLDDVMLSYAADGGGVGPHFDHYDVFLLQGQGRRRWRLGPVVDAQTPMRQDTDMNILAAFTTTDEWVLEPGDMLYIPPQVAHWGIAEGPCMTYSIGFRAPSSSEILLEYTQHLAETLEAHDRFTDAKFPPQSHPGEISPWAIARLQAQVRQLLDQPEALAHWFGCYMTEAKRQTPALESDTAQPLSLKPHVRAAYIADGERATLFISGQAAECSLALAQALCSYAPLQPTDFTEDDQELINEAIEEGWLHEP